jgi:RHS repeat-associated protein
VNLLSKSPKLYPPKFWVGIRNISDYSPFGVLLTERTVESANFRRGFQGQEHDDEVKGDGNSVNFKYRMHDPRLGRFFAVDPLVKKYPFYSAYQFSGNKVIRFIELEGLEETDPMVNKVRQLESNSSTVETPLPGIYNYDRDDILPDYFHASFYRARNGDNGPNPFRGLLEMKDGDSKFHSSSGLYYSQNDDDYVNSVIEATRSTTLTKSNNQYFEHVYDIITISLLDGTEEVGRIELVVWYFRKYEADNNKMLKMINFQPTQIMTLTGAQATGSADYEDQVDSYINQNAVLKGKRIGEIIFDDDNKDSQIENTLQLADPANNEHDQILKDIIDRSKSGAL